MRRYFFDCESPLSDGILNMGFWVILQPGHRVNHNFFYTTNLCLHPNLQAVGKNMGLR